MKKEKLSLIDSKGGLNDRDLASGIAVNEFQVLENYLTDDNGYLTKRPGKDLVQYTTILPQPFPDAQTGVLFLWHLDEATNGPFFDSGPNGGGLPNRLIKDGGDATSVAGVFPVGAPKGVALTQPSSINVNDDVELNGTLLKAQILGTALDGLPAVTFDAWIRVPSNFSGQPTTYTRIDPSTGISYDFKFSPSGSWIAASQGNPTYAQNFQYILPGEDITKLAAINGLSIFRDWDIVNGKDAGAPYIRFAIHNYGVIDTFTNLDSTAIPTDVPIHIRGTYDGASGNMFLYINGSQVGYANVVGGGNVYDSGPGNTQFFVGGRNNNTYSPAFPNANFNTNTCFPGMIDEVRVSGFVDTTFPYANPRGMGFEFAKSDGTRQAVISADDKLFFTLGDGAYTQMKMYGDALSPTFVTPSFSTTAYWDAIFRKDILYLSNGVDSPLAWDGSTLVAWMGSATPPILSLSGTAATITAGTRRVAFSYLYGTYETALSPYAEIANPGGFQLNVGNIPPRHANCTGVRIYMDKAATPGTWYLVREIAHTPGAIMSISGAYTAGSPAGYTTDSGALGPADASLGSTGYPLIEAQVATALSPNPQFLLAEHDRAFVCGMLDERYSLRWSELGALDVFTVFSFAQAAANQGNLIALASYYGEVHCSKDGRATLILRGANPQNWLVLETLHPSIGAIDHWSYVHRYPFTNDKYVLCFAARDGFYKYAGQQIECISDKISGTIKRLASGNATRNEWDVTTTAQWQAQTTALAGGSATANIQASRYETDGLRQVGGTAKIVDQLDYLGLWTGGAPLVSGNVISVCKGLAEGEFFFATDADNNLYHTMDNFQTLTLPTIAVGASVDERIIEIKQRGTSDFYFLFTDTAGTGQSSGGGAIYSWDNTASALNTLNAGPFFYDLDVSIRMAGGGNNGFSSSRSIGIENAFALSGLFSATSPNNVFVNHRQNVNWEINTTKTGTGPAFFLTKIDKNSAVNGVPTVNVLNDDTQTRGTAVTSTLIDSDIGFYSGVVVDHTPTTLTAHIAVNAFTAIYTRREFPLWRGGTYAPQAYWDATNSRMVFVASTPENASGNRASYLRTITSAGAVVNQYTATNVSAFTSDGNSVLMWTVEDQGGGTTGFGGRIRQSLLATPGTIVGSAGIQANVLALRLSYNLSNLTNYIGTFKSFNTGTQEFWTYTGEVRNIPTATSVAAVTRSATANGDSGTVFQEIAIQSVTPNRWYIAANKITAANASAVYVVDPLTPTVVTIQEGAAYQSPTGNAAATGIASNLLFVASSGNANGSLWADRLYWMTSAASNSDARFVQLGVPGNWTVIGVFQSEQHNLGTFSAFDDFESAFNNNNNSNGLLFEIRNAANPSDLSVAIYQQQAPNAKIVGFSPVAAYVQWRLTFTWTYAFANTTITSSPSADFVNIGFFLGIANLPRTVGFHWQGRTFWACAEDGAAQNNVVLVYQKSNSWMKIYGWNMKSIFRFRNQMVGLEAYQLVRLMTGRTDAGALIVGKARTGTIMGWVDKMLDRIQANIAAFANNAFSSLPGYVKVTPYQGDTAMTEGAWILAVPNGVENEPNRVLGEPDDEFSYSWGRAYSLEIKTSEDETGDWVPYVGQPENIQQIDLELEVTGDAYDLVVK